VLPGTEDITNLVHASPAELIGERTRLTRAIALWLLCHPDGAWAADIVRRLGADDRRLLADGVHAVRGRPSPAPEHAKVYAQFPWYQPSPRYTDRLLSETDRANIALADNPPAPPPPPAEPAADLTPAPAGGPTAKGMCGCAETPSGTASWAILGLAGIALASRRR
jgi:uncharacterized protein (TIGR03382 family)